MIKRSITHKNAKKERQKYCLAPTLREATLGSLFSGHSFFLKGHKDSLAGEDSYSVIGTHLHQHIHHLGANCAQSRREEKACHRV